jgi:hypothetical protein
MVFQNYAIFPHLNIFENVAFPLRARRVGEAEIKARVGAALELVRLARFADRFARQLSGGQQQRVAIARAIVYQPPIVLMDEPLGALDKNLRYEMQQEIKDIQQRLGMTVVYVTHDQEEAMNLSDRIAIMDHGRIQQAGPPAAIYERPANAFVARFLGEANLVRGTVQSVAHGLATLRSDDGAYLKAVAGEARPGQRAAVFVRPEKLGFAPTVTNSVEGTVVRKSFLGNIIRTVVDAGPGTQLTLDLPNKGSQGPGVGEPVTVGWAAEQSVVLGA